VYRLSLLSLFCPLSPLSRFGLPLALLLCL
jgi:hypothetical protein